MEEDGIIFMRAILKTLSR